MVCLLVVVVVVVLWLLTNDKKLGWVCTWFISVVHRFLSLVREKELAWKS